MELTGSAVAKIRVYEPVNLQNINGSNNDKKQTNKKNNYICTAANIANVLATVNGIATSKSGDTL